MALKHFTGAFLSFVALFGFSTDVLALDVPTEVPPYRDQRSEIQALDPEFTKQEQNEIDAEIKKFGKYEGPLLIQWATEQIQKVLSVIPGGNRANVKVVVLDTDAFIFHTYIDTVVFSRGAVEQGKDKIGKHRQYIRTDQGFRGVLAHEIAHQLQGHHVEMYKKKNQKIINFLTEIAGGVHESQQREHNSDSLSAYILFKLGDQPDAINEYFEKAIRDEKFEGGFIIDFLRSHGDSFGRMQRIKEIADRLGRGKNPRRPIPEAVLSEIVQWVAQHDSPSYQIRLYLDKAPRTFDTLEELEKFKAVFKANLHRMTLIELGKINKLLMDRQVIAWWPFTDLHKAYKSDYVSKSVRWDNLTQEFNALYLEKYGIPQWEKMNLHQRIETYLLLRPLHHYSQRTFKFEKEQVWKVPPRDYAQEAYTKFIAPEIEKLTLRELKDIVARFAMPETLELYVEKAIEGHRIRTVDRLFKFIDSYGKRHDIASRDLKNHYFEPFGDRLLSSLSAAAKAQWLLKYTVEKFKKAHPNEMTRRNLSWTIYSVFMSYKTESNPEYLIILMEKLLEEIRKYPEEIQAEESAQVQANREERGHKKQREKDNMDNWRTEIVGKLASIMKAEAFSEDQIIRIFTLARGDQHKLTVNVEDETLLKAFTELAAALAKKRTLAPKMREEMAFRERYSPYGIGLLSPRELVRLAKHYCKSWACARKNFFFRLESREYNRNLLPTPQDKREDAAKYAPNYNDLFEARREVAYHFGTTVEKIIHQPRADLNIWELALEYDKTLNENKSLSFDEIQRMKEIWQAKRSADVLELERGWNEFYSRFFSPRDKIVYSSFAHQHELLERMGFVTERLDNILARLAARQYQIYLANPQPFEMNTHLEWLAKIYLYPKYSLSPMMARPINRRTYLQRVRETFLKRPPRSIDEVRIYLAAIKRGLYRNDGGKVLFVEPEYFATLTLLRKVAARNGVELPPYMKSNIGLIAEFAEDLTVDLTLGENMIDKKGAFRGNESLYQFNKWMRRQIDHAIVGMSFEQALAAIEQVYPETSYHRDSILLRLFEDRNVTVDQAWQIHRLLYGGTAITVWVRQYKKKYMPKFKKVSFEEYYTFLSRAISGYSLDADEFNFELLAKATRSDQVDRARARMFDEGKRREDSDSFENLMEFAQTERLWQSILDGAVDQLWPSEKSELLIWLMGGPEPAFFRNKKYEQYDYEHVRTLMKERFGTMGRPSRKKFLLRMLMNLENKGLLTSAAAEQKLLEYFIYRRIGSRAHADNKIIYLALDTFVEVAKPERKAALYETLLDAMYDRKDIKKEEVVSLFLDSLGPVGKKGKQTLYMLQSRLPESWVKEFKTATDRTEPMSRDRMFEVLGAEIQAATGKTIDEVIASVDEVLGSASTSTAFMATLRGHSKSGKPTLIDRMPIPVQRRFYSYMSSWFPETISRMVDARMAMAFDNTKAIHHLQSLQINEKPAKEILEIVKRGVRSQVLTELQNGALPKELPDLVITDAFLDRMLEEVWPVVKEIVNQDWIIELLKTSRFGGLTEVVRKYIEGLDGTLQRAIRYFNDIQRGVSPRKQKEMARDLIRTSLKDTLTDAASRKGKDAQWVVKVQDPNRSESMEEDLRILEIIAERIHARRAEFGVEDAPNIIARIARMVRGEQDYRVQAENARTVERLAKPRFGVFSRIADWIFGRKRAQITEIHPEFVGTSAMAEKRAEGHKFSDIAAGEVPGYDVQKVYKGVISVIVNQAFVFGKFGHGDPHDGNFFINPKGKVQIDFGIVYSLSSRQVDGLLTLFRAYDDYQKTPSTKNAESILEGIVALDGTSQKASQPQVRRELLATIQETMKSNATKNSGFDLLNLLSVLEAQSRLKISDDIFKVLRTFAMVIELRPTGMKYFKNELRKIVVKRTLQKAPILRKLDWTLKESCDALRI